MLFSYCWKFTILLSSRYVLTRGNLEYTNSSSAVSALKWLYNWSSLALASPLVHCCMNRADISGAFRRGTIAKTARTTTTKSCQLQARGPPFIVWHPLWDTYGGWDGASVSSTRQHRETFVRWQRVTVESWTNWLITDWQSYLGSVCLPVCVTVCSQRPCVVLLPPVQNGQIWCFLSPSCRLSNIHGVISLQMMLPLLLPLRLHPLPLSSTPADLSQIPQMCLFMCSAKWSDREKHLQPKRGKQRTAC